MPTPLCLDRGMRIGHRDLDPLNEANGGKGHQRQSGSGAESSKNRAGAPGSPPGLRTASASSRRGRQLHWVQSIPSAPRLARLARRSVQSAWYVARGSSVPAIRRIVHVLPACPPRCALPDEQRSRSHAVSGIRSLWTKRGSVVDSSSRGLLAWSFLSPARRDVEAIDGLGRPTCRPGEDLRKRGLILRAVAWCPRPLRLQTRPRAGESIAKQEKALPTSNLEPRCRREERAPSPQLTSCWLLCEVDLRGATATSGCFQCTFTFRHQTIGTDLPTDQAATDVPIGQSFDRQRCG